MKFLSVCSGIEAASVAWEPLGWRPVGFSEIESFPAEVLKHHYPDVINYGDMTKLVEMFDLGLIELPDVLCGGTPCQAFSVAGLRKSLEDERGNLSLVFCEIANAIDRHRVSAGLEAGIVFWENVPGVLSTKDNAFGCFLAGLAGESEPLQPAGGKWTDAGVVLGPQRAVAWRVLDAQYFGLAQRRRRVFVVASAREGFDPAAVLLEFQGVRRDFAPSREAGQRVAPTIAGCANGGGANGPGRDVDSCESLQVSRSHWDGDYPHPTLNQSAKGTGGVGSSNQELFSQRGAYLAPAVMSSGQANAEIRTDGGAPTPTCLHEAPIVAHSLRGEGFDASKDGTGRGTPLVPVGVPDVMATLLSSTAGISRVGNAVTEHETYIPMAPQPVAIQGNLIGRDAGGPHGIGASTSGLMYTLTTADVHGVAMVNMQGSKHAIAAPVAFHPTQDPISSTDVCHAIGTGSVQGCATAAVLQPIPLDLRNAGRDPEKHDEMNRQGVGVGEPGEPAHTVTSAFVHGVAVGTDCYNGTITGDVAATMGTPGSSVNASGPTVMQPVTYDLFNVTAPVNRQSRKPGDPCHTLARSNAEHAAVVQPIALQDVRGIEKAQNGRGWNDDGTAYTVDTHATQGVAQPIAWDEELNASVDQAGTLLRGGDGGRHDGVLAPTLTASNDPSRSPQSSEITAQVAAVVRATGFDAYNNSVTGDVAKTLDVGQDHHHVPLVQQQTAMQVRRLTPVECERLQGFPDGYTNIPWRGKSESPDGPRYKALGNSWAVPVVRWIGQRVQWEVWGLL